MSLSSHIINNMSIISLLKYLKNTYTRKDLMLEYPLSYTTRINANIKSPIIKSVDHIISLRDLLETMYEKYDGDKIAHRTMEVQAKELKVFVIDLLDRYRYVKNPFVKNMRLELNDYIQPNLLVEYAKNKLDEAKNDISSDKMVQLARAYKLADEAVNLKRAIDATPGLYDIDYGESENIFKTKIAQAAEILHTFDDYTSSSSKITSLTVAGNISKKRIKKNIINTKKRRKYKRNKSRRSRH